MRKGTTFSRMFGICIRLRTFLISRRVLTAGRSCHVAQCAYHSIPWNTASELNHLNLLNSRYWAPLHYAAGGNPYQESEKARSLHIVSSREINRSSFQKNVHIHHLAFRIAIDFLHMVKTNRMVAYPTSDVEIQQFEQHCADTMFGCFFKVSLT